MFKGGEVPRKDKTKKSFGGGEGNQKGTTGRGEKGKF